MMADASGRKASNALWNRGRKPIVAMVHLAALPSAPGFEGDWPAVRARMLADARLLAEGGADALMLENFGDAPFYPGAVPVAVVAQIAALAAELKREFDLPLGINVLRNDGLAALAIAHAVGAEFIRVNVLCGARLCDQGIVQGIAHDLLRLRRQLNARHIAILADVDVKHSAPLAPLAPAVEVADLIGRGGADAVIVSGSGTGQPVDTAKLRAVKAAAGDTPVLLGSGVSAASLPQLWPHAEGFIVGTSLKCDAIAANPVDAARVGAFFDAVSALRA